MRYSVYMLEWILLEGGKGGAGVIGSAAETDKTKQTETADYVSPLSEERARKWKRGAEWFSLGSSERPSWTVDLHHFWP